jgi:tripartite ATP-independent transporter DctP family solute receptor
MHMTFTRRTFLKTGVAGATMLTAPSILRAQGKTTLKYAHVYEANEPYHTWAVWAGQEFEKRTNGKYAIQVYPASALGKESDINEGLGLGTVDMIYTGQLFAGRAHGPLAIGGAPFMFRDYKHWDTFRGSKLFDELAAGYDKKTGNKVITITYYGERHVTANKALNTPADMKNLKIRVPDAPLYRMFPEAVGANPTPIAFAEVYLALSQGVVDAQENPLPTIQAKKFYEVNKFIMLTGHITDALLTIVGGPTWGKLNAQEREQLTAVLKEAAVKCTDDIIKAEKDLVEWFKKNNTTVVAVDRKPFRDAVVERHNGPAATWSKDIYDQLQKIGGAA